MPQDQPEIGLAVYAAGPGDTVLVAPGVYEERGIFIGECGIVVRSELGSRATAIHPPPTTLPEDYVFRVGVPGDSSTVLEGFTIDGCGTCIAGIDCYRSDSRPTIRYNVIHCSRGLFLEYGTQAHVYSNTLVGCGGYGIILDRSSPTIERNVVTGWGVGIRCDPQSSPQFACNDVWGNTEADFWSTCGDQIGQHGNFSADPMFCDPSTGDFMLHCDSPCLPGQHPDGFGCGLVGALDVGCGGSSATAQSTWGLLRTLFERPRLQD